MRYQDKPIHRLQGTSSLANIYKKDTPGQKPMNITKKIIEAIVEAKIGDKVTVVHGSQKGLVGHVGEIRKGLGGRDHTYTVDYDDNGKRASVQVKKAHVKKLAEANDELNRKTPSEDEIMAKHSMSKTEFDHQLAIGMKVEMEHTKNAMVARQIAMDHLGEKPDYYSKLKKMVEQAEPIVEISKRLMGRYVQKAATSMATAAFGQGQASAQYKPPSEQDQKTGSKRMAGIVRATSKMAKEEVELVNEAQTPETLKKMSDYHFKQQYHHEKKAADKSLSDDARKAHAMARAHHANAGENYLKASRDDGLMRDRYIDRAENHADAAEEHERKHHAVMEDVSQVHEDKDQEHFTVHAFTPALKHIDTPSKHSSKKEADNEGHNYSAQGHVVVHHKADGSKKVATASFEPGTSAFAKSEMKQRALNYKNVQEQELMAVGDRLEKSRKNFTQKKSREAYIHHKDREMHQTHQGKLGTNEETIAEAHPTVMAMAKTFSKGPRPHVVSLTLTHPNDQGPIHKKVKVNAKSPAHASEMAEKHYEGKGYKIEKVHYASSLR